MYHGQGYIFCDDIVCMCSDLHFIRHSHQIEVGLISSSRYFSGRLVLPTPLALGYFLESCCKSLPQVFTLSGICSKNPAPTKPEVGAFAGTKTTSVTVNVIQKLAVSYVL